MAKGSYALLTIVTFFRRDATLPPMLLTDPDNDGRWLVDKTNVPEGISTVRELIKPAQCCWKRMPLETIFGNEFSWPLTVLIQQMQQNPRIGMSRLAAKEEIL